MITKKVLHPLALYFWVTHYHGNRLFFVLVTVVGVFYVSIMYFIPSFVTLLLHP